MRNFGGIVLILAIFAFIYCSSQMDQYEPLPQGKSVNESLEYSRGRWEVARYACGAAAGFGLLMAMYPKGR